MPARYDDIVCAIPVVGTARAANMAAIYDNDLRGRSRVLVVIMNGQCPVITPP